MASPPTQTLATALAFLPSSMASPAARPFRTSAWTGPIAKHRSFVFPSARCAVSLRAPPVRCRVEHVRPLATTLHDEELSPGDIMTSDDMLDKTEAGFSVYYPPEYHDAVRAKAKEVIDAVGGIAIGDGKDGHVLVICGHNEMDIGISFLATRMKIFTLPLKHQQVLDFAKESVCYDRTIGIPPGCPQLQEQSGSLAQTHKATVCPNIIAHESGIHQSPTWFNSCLVTVNNFLKVVFTIICISKQSPECLGFMWQMVQPCLQVVAFFGLGIMFALGLALMYYGWAVVLKEKSTSNSA